MTLKSENDYTGTYTGRKVYVLNPNPETLVIEDISHALAMLCRYTGHTKKFYSVAEHSVLLSHVVSKKNAKWALMHDASEAYFGDLARPVKQLPQLKPYRDAEIIMQRALAIKFDLPLKIPKEVLDNDNNMVFTEAPIMLKNFDLENQTLKGFKTLKNVKFQYLLPDAAKKLFMARFNELFL